MTIKEILEQAKKDGKKVDGLGEDALATVGTILEGLLAPIATQMKTLGEQLNAANAKNAELEKKVGEVATAASSSGESKDDKSKGKVKEGDEASGVLAKIAERLEALEANVTGKDKAASASQLLDTVLKAKFPNLKLTERQRARFLSAGFDSADKLEADIRAELEDLKALGVTATSTTANPEGEGAKSTAGATDKTKEQDAIKKVRSIGATGNV